MPRLTHKGEENTGIISGAKDEIHKVEIYEVFYVYNNLKRIDSPACTIFRDTFKDFCGHYTILRQQPSPTQTYCIDYEKVS